MAMVLLSNSSFGQIALNLRDDNEFVDLVIEMNDFKNFIDITINKQNLSLNDVINKLNGINDKKLNYETQLTEINKVFNISVSDRYLKHMKIFNKNWASINRKFQNITSKYLEEEYQAVMNKKAANFSSGSGVGCGWQYNLCIAAAGAGAVLCHGGCETTALATTAGLGIPACIWLCSTLQVAASVQCYDTYCK